MKILGLALIVISIGLAIWAYQLSGSAGSQLTKLVTGSDTDKVMGMYIAAAVSFVFGVSFYRK